MAVYRDARDRKWRYRKTITLPDGGKTRISGTPSINTKVAAEDAERAQIARARDPRPAPLEPPTKEVLTLEELWPDYVREYLAFRPTRTQSTSKDIYRKWLHGTLGPLPLRDLAAAVPSLRAKVKEEIRTRQGSDGHKSINNVTSVVGSVLGFAVLKQLLPGPAPRLGRLPETPREIEPLELETYARLVRAARAEGWPWLVAVALAGEAGLRVGEVQEIRWREDVDLVGETLTVQRKNADGSRIEATKGKERRHVPITPCLLAALRSASRIRDSLLVCRPDGSALTRKEMDGGLARLCRRAGLPGAGWHRLRHSFGTHAALLGVNPWRLQTWMGHKSITTTMGYVKLAEAHRRSVPPELLRAGAGETDPDRRVVLMLGARGEIPANGLTTERQKTRNYAE